MTMDEIKTLFIQFVICSNASDFSFLNFLKYCKMKSTIKLENKRLYFSVYKEGLKSKSHDSSITKTKAKELTREADRLLRSYDVSVLNNQMMNVFSRYSR